jgi:hypothetical protein
LSKPALPQQTHGAEGYLGAVRVLYPIKPDFKRLVGDLIPDHFAEHRHAFVIDDLVLVQTAD